MYTRPLPLNRSPLAFLSLFLTLRLALIETLSGSRRAQDAGCVSQSYRSIPSLGQLSLKSQPPDDDGDEPGS